MLCMQIASVALRVLTGRPTLSSVPGDSLEGINTTTLPDGALCWVTEVRSLYILSKASTETADGSDIVQPAAGGGRWRRYTSGIDVAFPDLRPGVAAAAPTAATVGPTYGWLLGAGDEVYVENPLASHGNTAQPILVVLAWAPTVAEAGKTVGWQIDVGFEKAGSIVSTIDYTDLVSVAVPATQYEYTRTIFSIPASSWAADPDSEEIHVRFQRKGTASDPSQPPGVHHVAVIQPLVS